MSLPQRVLVAGSPSIPQVLTAGTAPTLGVPEPTYLAGLRQVRMMQLTRLFDQLAELSSYANELFVDLANKTLQMSERINNVGQILAKTKSDMELVESEIASADFSGSLQRERYSWKSDYPLTTNLFSKSTKNASIDAAYKKCRAAPQLDVLDEYRNDGQTCMKFYSYPEFFVEEWKALMVKEHDGKKARRKARDHNENTEQGQQDGSGTQDRDGAMSGTGDSSGRNTKFINITVSTNTRQHVDVSSAMSAPHMSTMTPGRFGGFEMGRENKPMHAQSMYEASAPIRKPPPPPPPPPPMYVAAPPPPPGAGIVATPDTMTPGFKSPQSTTSAPTGGVNFLSDIRSKQFNLRKTDVDEATKDGKRRSKKPTSDGEEVAAILMRRVAIEMSDSDGDDGDDEDDEWN